MLKYTSTNMSSNLRTNNYTTDKDVFIFIVMAFTILFTLAMLHSVNMWNKVTKKPVADVMDSCFSSSVNVYSSPRYEQQLSPIRRSRSIEPIDSMV